MVDGSRPHAALFSTLDRLLTNFLSGEAECWRQDARGPAVGLIDGGDAGSENVLRPQASSDHFGEKITHAPTISR